MMSPLPLSNHQDFNSLLVYPLGLCATTTVTTYVLSIITGNSSQVDRLWTFLPTIYTAYWALLPLWPHKSATWRNLVLVPYVPDEASHFARHFSPRALLILGLTVRILAPEYTCVTSTDTLQRFCGCAGYPIIPGDVAYSDCAFSWPLTHPTVFDDISTGATRTTAGSPFAPKSRPGYSKSSTSPSSVRPSSVHTQTSSIHMPTAL
jgi:hypothetical protein